LKKTIPTPFSIARPGRRLQQERTAGQRHSTGRQTAALNVPLIETGRGGSGFRKQRAAMASKSNPALDLEANTANQGKDTCGNIAADKAMPSSPQSVINKSVGTLRIQ